MMKWNFSRTHRLPALEPSHDFPVAHQFQGTFALALAYLALPCLIFLLTFVRPWIGIPLASVIACACYAEVSRHPCQWGGAHAALAATMSLLLVFVIGIPSGHSAWDWIKHWALINELASQPWPVQVDLHGTTGYLRFYLAAYLVPALPAKLIAGFPVAVSTSIWFWAGYVLVFQCVVVGYGRGRSAAAAGMMLLLLLLGGADALAESVIRASAHLQQAPWLGIHFENWALDFRQPLQFTSGLGNLAWVPHQSIATYLVAATLLLDRSEGSLRRGILSYGLLALWSPFGMLGLLPTLLLRVLPRWRLLRDRRSVVAIVGGAAFALLIASYLATDATPAAICLQCIATRSAADVMFYAIFLLVELSSFVLLLRGRIGRDAYCAVACATLVVLPFLHGDSADLVMRASMGPLFVLARRAADTLFGQPRPMAHWLAVCLGLAICLPTTISEAVFHLEKGRAHAALDANEHYELNQKLYRTFSLSSTIHVPEFLTACGWQYQGQYFSTVRPTVIEGP